MRVMFTVVNQKSICLKKPQYVAILTRREMHRDLPVLLLMKTDTIGGVTELTIIEQQRNKEESL